MTAEVVSVPESATCAEALELIDRHGIRILPVVGPDRSVRGTVSLAHLGGVFIPRVREPRLMRQVDTSLAHIVRALHGRPLNLVDADRIESLFVRLGTMDIRSFWSLSLRENIPAEKSIIVVGDRRDVHLRAIELGMRGLIVTGNSEVDAGTLERAHEKGVRFAVSQVEELGFGNFWRHARPLARALQEMRDEEHLAFAALLVTDINTQNSLLLVKGAPEVIRRVDYPHVEQDEIFDLPGIVSRKKQLIPYLTSMLDELAAEGTMLSSTAASRAKKTERPASDAP